MADSRPSLTMLRDLTDRHVLQVLIDEPRATRAELAHRTGISKPTVAESIRRLTAAGTVLDTGERTSGRGAVGSYFALAPDAGLALALSIGSDELVGELLDIRGAVLDRVTTQVRRPVRPDRLRASVTRLAHRLAQPLAQLLAQPLGAAGAAPLRVATVSAADPVDRRTGVLVRLPNAPFLLGALDPAGLLAATVDGPVIVDNDVNWAARAERAAAETGTLDDFVYLFLGEGLGGAVVADGEVRRGHGGFAGEIADVPTTGARGRATAFLDVFADLGLRRADSTVLDVPALLAAIEQRPAVLTAIATAVSGVIRAAVAFADPARVVLGGPWGTHPGVVAAVADAVAGLPRSVAVRPATVVDAAPLAGARADAVDRLRQSVLGRTAVAGQRP